MFKNTVMALQGTVVAQGIAFLFLPILTRVYTPEAFGMYQVYISLLGIIFVITALKYDSAILASKKNGEQQGLIRLCVVLNLIVACFVFFICQHLTTQRPAWLIISNDTLHFLPVAAFAGGLLQIFGFVLLHEQAVAINSITKIIQVALFCIAGLVATFPLPQSGLVGADVFSRIAVTVLIIIWLARNRSSVFTYVSNQHIVDIARRFREYPMLAVPGGLLTAAMGFAVPIFMLAAFDGTVMGQYALVERTLLLPAGLIGQAVGQAFAVQLSDSVEKKRVNPQLFKKVGLVMFGLGFLPTVGLFTFAPILFNIIFGPQWAIAGSFAQVLSIVFLSSIVMSPFHMTLVIVNRQRDQFAWEATRIFLIILAWIIIIKGSLHPLHAVILHSLVLVTMNIAFIWLAYRALRIKATDNEETS